MCHINMSYKNKNPHCDARVSPCVSRAWGRSLTCSFGANPLCHRYVTWRIQAEYIWFLVNTAVLHSCPRIFARRRSKWKWLAWEPRVRVCKNVLDPWERCASMSWARSSGKFLFPRSFKCQSATWMKMAAVCQLPPTVQKTPKHF